MTPLGCSKSLQKRPREEVFDRFTSRFLELSCARTGEVRMHDARALLVVSRLPVLAGPPEPPLALLIEHMKFLIAQLGELGTPSGTAADGLVVENRPDDPDFLAAIHLIPHRLQNFSDRRRIGVPALHEAAD